MTAQNKSTHGCVALVLGGFPKQHAGIQILGGTNMFAKYSNDIFGSSSLLIWIGPTCCNTSMAGYPFHVIQIKGWLWELCESPEFVSVEGRVVGLWPVRTRTHLVEPMVPPHGLGFLMWHVSWCSSAQDLSNAMISFVKYICSIEIPMSIWIMDRKFEAGIGSLQICLGLGQIQIGY